MTSQQRPTLQHTLEELARSHEYKASGVICVSAGQPTKTIVVNALTFGTELNGLRAIQRVQELANLGKLMDVKIFLVGANIAAAIGEKDYIRQSLNRLPPDFERFGNNLDMLRAATLAAFFKTQKIDVVCDFQENSLISREGAVVDIGGETELLNTVCDSLPCPDRLMGITAVQQSALASGTSPFATIYNAKAAIEVLLPSTSRQDGSVERIVFGAGHVL
jgi:hypothetical protein